MAGLPLGAPAKTALVNATFFIKNAVSDIVKSIMILNNEDASSGPQIDNVQKNLNESNTIYKTEISLGASEQLTLDLYSKDQVFKVGGGAGDVSLDNIPFDNIPKNGTIVTFIGHDDNKAVRINENDNDEGFYINDAAILKRGYI